MFETEALLFIGLMLGTALLSVLFRALPSRRRGRSWPIIIENAFGLRILMLLLGLPALYLTDVHIAYSWAA